jgi:hypothetical protein
VKNLSQFIEKMSYLYLDDIHPDQAKEAANFLLDPTKKKLLQTIERLKGHSNYGSVWDSDDGSDDDTGEILERRRTFLQTIQSGEYLNRIKEERREQRRKEWLREQQQINNRFKENRLQAHVIDLDVQFPPPVRKGRKRVYTAKDGQDYPYPTKKQAVDNGVLILGPKDAPTGYQDMISGHTIPNEWRRHYRKLGTPHRVGSMIVHTYERICGLWSTVDNTYRHEYTNVVANAKPWILGATGQVIGHANRRTVITPTISFILDYDGNGTLYHQGEEIWGRFKLPWKTSVYVYEKGTLWCEPIDVDGCTQKRVKRTYRLFQYDEQRVQLLEDLLPMDDVRSHILNFLRPQV